jgi:hypothetical protein
MQRNKHGNHIHGPQRIDVIPVEWLKKQDLVPGVEQGGAGCLERAGGSHADHDILFRVQVQPLEAALAAGDGPAEFRQAVKPCVDVVSLAHGLLRPLDDGLGHVQVADALGQVDAACFGAGQGHASDVGLFYEIATFALPYRHDEVLFRGQCGKESQR